ncbi:MAG: 16S rRNA (guanine(966)-N(2))-methyltransferase RsmD [Caldilineaceae bacterium]|nr:16S rRNA (guanine(966)-N(2))-methyltransferase RsmD [Caldilineaceae bacterium]MCB9139027.1 16S rRNA (guanine(966)-N(2))-methyltransferase RsmD [Caldilineaceae bacterium]
MRIIAGSAKGHKLQMVPGDSTRPITDRAKEALFSILGDWIEGSRVLDLFGGTGGVGLEALSRGAEFVYFVELNRRAVKTLKNNAENCGFAEQVLIERGDSFAFLNRYTGPAFDLIYVAPPQYEGLWRKALMQIDERPELLVEDGDIIVQIHPKEEEPLALTYLAEYDRRQYGSVLLLFYTAAEHLTEPDDEE